MNVEELEQLVARARDAEGRTSQPPPALLADARRAARRRRRVMTLGTTTGAAVLVVVAGVVAPGWLSEGEGVDVSSQGDELAARGGPCPATLPAPTDDEGGHGFGADASATREPHFSKADAAWICLYGASESGRTSNGGTVFVWARTEDVRRVDDAELTRVDHELDGIAADRDDNQACTADLGPRYLLVTSAGGDLTGTVVDDYGCRDVRLTDDPFTTAPGDPQEGGGTVAGVLTAPDGFVDSLRDWWDTSPAESDAATPPEAMHVTCTDAGPEVDTRSVSAQPTGVVLVVDSTLAEGSYLTYRSAGDGPAGGDPAPRTPTTATYLFPPGDLTLGCATAPDMDETGTVMVTVEDPHGYWRDATLVSYGCGPGGAQPSWIAGLTGSASTARNAVDRMLENAHRLLGRQLTAEPADIGYSGASTQTWVALENGVPALTIAVTDMGNGYEAGPDALCG